MDISTLKTRESEKGFTLVELAVVMIIIGVLIGGVLKGQEMVENARVTAAAGDLERFGAAYNSFLDIYSVQPGDMNTAAARLADCGVYAACVNGDGDGIIDPVVGAAVGNDESTFFWGQLLAAGLISGMDGSNNGAAAAFGVTNPSSPVGGGYKIGDRRAGNAVGGFNSANMRARPHVVLDGIVGATTATSGVIIGSQAAAIDTRLDDGNPQVGTVLGTVGATSCVNAAASTSYDNANLPCAVAYRM